jgi:hypothetical protein
VKRILIAATLAAALAPAATASGQGATPPPGQQSTIAVRVGSTLDAVPCQIASGRTLIAPGRPWQPGDPPPSVDALPFIDPNVCRGRRPVVLRRARHMTVTLLGQSPQVAATWFRGGRPTPLVVRPVGEPPTAIWFLRLPLTSGKLVLHMWYPVRTTFQGEVTQGRADYKLAIRRKAEAVPAPPPTEPPVADPVIPIDSTPPQPAAPTTASGR